MSFEMAELAQTVAIWGAGISLAIAFFAIGLHIYIMIRAMRLAKKEHVRREVLKKPKNKKRRKRRKG